MISALNGPVLLHSLRAEEHRRPWSSGVSPSPLGDQDDPLPSRLFVGVPLVHGGHSSGRADRVHVDAVGGDLVRQVTREAQEPCLRGRITGGPVKLIRLAATDATLTMRPQRFRRMWGNTALKHRKGPVRFTSRTPRHFSSSRSSTSSVVRLRHHHHVAVV